MKQRILLAGYCANRGGWLLLAVCQFFLLPLVCWLYGLPLQPVLYASIIMATAFLLFAAVDFWRYACRIRSMERQKAQAPFGDWDFPPHGLEEKLFLEILTKVRSYYQEEEQRREREKAAAVQYYALWSHQAKTPLAAIRLLLQEEHPDRNALEQSLFQAQQYVDMALQYQRLNDSANDLLLRRCSLERIVKQAAKEVSTLFIYKKVGLVLGDLKKEVLTDSKWLQFVIAQLLTNAVKYTPSGSVSVWCEGEVLYIRDTGIGIRPEDLPRIFEWGYTGCNGHKQSRSTGIGLNLCKRALGMLGHTIVIRSQPGYGTTVEVGLSRRELENE